MPVPVPPLAFVKGHGTENDFLVIPDADGHHLLTPDLVAALCDRRAGLGADGVLRVVRTASDQDGAEWAGSAEWFMDYRNADGSLSEMCGNGARVVAAWLRREGLVGGDFPLATRGGVRDVRYEPDGAITVDMGPSDLAGTDTDLGPAAATVQVGADGRTFEAVRVHLPNPHAVAFVGSLADAGPLLTAPALTPEGAFPEGANVEFAALRGSAHVAMRVYERGSGETRSCGTGACAVAVVARRRAGLSAADGAERRWRVDVPGGTLTVTERADAHLELTGPAVLVAAGEVHPDWPVARSYAPPVGIPA